MTTITYTNPITKTEHTTSFADAITNLPNADQFATAFNALEDIDTQMSDKWLDKLDKTLWKQRQLIMGDLIMDEYNNLTETEIVQSAKHYALFCHAHDLMSIRIELGIDN